MLSWFRRWRAQRASASERVDDSDAIDDDAIDDDAIDSDEPPAPVLTDELDLHTFLPKECADVVEEYVRAAHEAGFATVRIIHGKGKGTLRRIVHAALTRHPAVRSFQIAEPQRGSWGATIVELAPKRTD